MNAASAAVDSAISHISTTAFMSLRNADKLPWQQSNGRLWDIDTGHDLMITEPRKVAELLDHIAALPSDRT